VASCFFAVRPGAAARSRLAACARALLERSGGRAVPPANYHLTLAFLGSLAPERLAAATRAAAAVRAERFAFTLDRVGSFRGARVAWAGSSAPAARLVELQARLARALAAGGFVLEERAFAPHVTLARRIERTVAREPIGAIAWDVAEFALMRSEAGAYATLAAWPLGEMPPD
jgi:RNA 2',3'-cyclic 3'-phosphodiesterase